MVTKIIRLCDVCAHAGTETVDAQPLIITVNRGAEQSIDLCEACHDNFVLPFLGMFQELGRPAASNGGPARVPAGSNSKRMTPPKRVVPKRTSTGVLVASAPAPAPAPVLEPAPVAVASPDAPKVEPIFACNVDDCDFETKFLKGYIAHATKKHHQSWDEIAQTIGTLGGDYLCTVCGLGFPTKDRANTHARARHPEQAR